MPILGYILLTGMVSNLIKNSIEKKSKIFKKIIFKDKNGNYPKILKIIKNKKDKKRCVIVCKSYIPFKTWLDNQHNLEMLFNSKLKLIQQDRRIVKLIKLGGQ